MRQHIQFKSVQQLQLRMTQLLNHVDVNEDDENNQTGEQNQPKPEPIFALGIISIQTLKDILAEKLTSDQ